MTMDMSVMAVDNVQYPAQTNLQSLISIIKRHSIPELELQIGKLAANEEASNEAVSTNSIIAKTSLLRSTDRFRCAYNDDSDLQFKDHTQSEIGISNMPVRFQSLRSALWTPLRPKLGRRKTVHFADSCGLDLVHQKYYNANDFTTDSEKFETIFPALSKASIIRPGHATLLLAKFQQRSDAEIIRLISTKSVCLQCVHFVDMNIIGTINVLNIAYEKQVYVRYTTDYWRTFIETSGRYKSSIKDDSATMDKFAFIISLPVDFPIGATCEFCIRYIVDGNTYWDNNQGANYTVQAV